MEKHQLVRALGCLVKDERVLLVRLKSESAKFFELPGGAVDFGMDPQRSLIQTFLEITGYIIEPFVPYNASSTLSDDGTKQTIQIAYLVEHIDDGEAMILNDIYEEFLWADYQEIDELFASTQLMEETFVAAKLGLDLRTDERTKHEE